MGQLTTVIELDLSYFIRKCIKAMSAKHKNYTIFIESVTVIIERLIQIIVGTGYLNHCQ